MKNSPISYNGFKDLNHSPLADKQAIAKHKSFNSMFHLNSHITKYLDKDYFQYSEVLSSPTWLLDMYVYHQYVRIFNSFKKMLILLWAFSVTIKRSHIQILSFSIVNPYITNCHLHLQDVFSIPCLSVKCSTKMWRYIHCYHCWRISHNIFINCFYNFNCKQKTNIHDLHICCMYMLIRHVV